MKEETVEAPVVVAGKLVLFPHMCCTVHLRTPESESAMRTAHAVRRPVAVFANRFDSPDEGVGQMHAIGTLALVRDIGRHPCCGRAAAELRGIARVRITAWTRYQPPRQASCSVMPLGADAEIDARRLALEIRNVAGRIRQQFQQCLHTREAAHRLAESNGPEEVLGAVGGLLFHLQTFQRQQILELEPLSARLEAVLFELQERLARSTPATLLH